QVLVPVVEAADAAHAITGAVIEVERADGLERVLVEQRTLGGVEAALVLQEGVRSRLQCRDAADPELRRHVAEAGPEEERDGRRVAEQRADLPSSKDGRPRAAAHPFLVL